jgi:hypothetical protein
MASSALSDIFMLMVKGRGEKDVKNAEKSQNILKNN